MIMTVMERRISSFSGRQTSPAWPGLVHYNSDPPGVVSRFDLFGLATDLSYQATMTATVRPILRLQGSGPGLQWFYETQHITRNVVPALSLGSVPDWLLQAI